MPLSAAYLFLTVSVYFLSEQMSTSPLALIGRLLTKKTQKSGGARRGWPWSLHSPTPSLTIRVWGSAGKPVPPQPNRAPLCKSRARALLPKPPRAAAQGATRPQHGAPRSPAGSPFWGRSARAPRDGCRQRPPRLAARPRPRPRRSGAGGSTSRLLLPSREPRPGQGASSQDCRGAAAAGRAAAGDPALRRARAAGWGAGISRAARRVNAGVVQASGPPARANAALRSFSQGAAAGKGPAPAESARGSRAALRPSPPHCSRLWAAARA